MSQPVNVIVGFHAKDIRSIASFGLPLLMLMWGNLAGFAG